MAANTSSSANTREPSSLMDGNQTKIVDRLQFFKRSDDDKAESSFDEDVIVFSRGGRLFVSRVREKRPWLLKDADMDALEGLEIKKDVVFPKYEEGKFTLAHESDPEFCYVKHPSLKYYKSGDECVNVWIGKLMLREATACEVLRKSPHENIEKYHGCLVEDGRVVGLCFDEYEETLKHRMKKGMKAEEKNRVYRQVRDAVRHMHGLGYCHNDVNPNNIMMKGDDAMLIDFDSSLPEGEELLYKGGHPDWSISGANHSKRENDYYTLAKLRDYLGVKEADFTCL